MQAIQQLPFNQHIFLNHTFTMGPSNVWNHFAVKGNTETLSAHQRGHKWCTHTHPHLLWQSGRLRENMFTASMVPWIWEGWKHDPFPWDNHEEKHLCSSQWKAKARNIWIVNKLLQMSKNLIQIRWDCWNDWYYHDYKAGCSNVHAGKSMQCLWLKFVWAKLQFFSGSRYPPRLTDPWFEYEQK